jgi:hypothetical protein
MMKRNKQYNGHNHVSSSTADRDPVDMPAQVAAYTTAYSNQEALSVIGCSYSRAAHCRWRVHAVLRATALRAHLAHEAQPVALCARIDQVARQPQECEHAHGRQHVAARAWRRIRRRLV